MISIYQAFGLRLASDLPLDGFAAAPAGPAEVTIETDDLARQAVEAGGAEPMRLAAAGPTGWCFRVPEVGDYLIRSGSEIHISPLPGVPAGHIMLFLAGSALGMILHQRGLHSLHAATVAIEGAAIAFVGNQGAGKSTLAATMAGAGHRVLGDDVMVLRPEGAGIIVHPGAAQFKLWQETVEALEIAPGAQIANRLAKYYVGNPGEQDTTPTRLGAVVELLRGPQNSDFDLERVPLLPAIDLATRHGYRAEWVALLGTQRQQFEHCAALTARIPVWRLTRPEGLGHLTATRLWLERHWDTMTCPV